MNEVLLTLRKEKKAKKPTFMIQDSHKRKRIRKRIREKNKRTQLFFNVRRCCWRQEPKSPRQRHPNEGNASLADNHTHDSDKSKIPSATILECRKSNRSPNFALAEFLVKMWSGN